MKLRMISRGLVAALVVVVALVIVVHDRLADTQAAPRLTGTDLGATAAPAFTLSDQSGARVSLAGLHGHPVVLTFLYTHCPDECPLTAEKLSMAADQLGVQAAARVAWVAISVDPVGDTPTTATAFVHAHGLDGRLRYLLGTQQQLAPVWQAYHVSVTPGANGEIDHALVLYVVDAQGRERVLLDATFTPTQLAGDLRALLAGG
jgi:protein SCO1/2